MGTAARDRVFVGISGHVVALEVTTGREVWRTKLSGRSFVTTGVSDGKVLAGTRGHLYALDPVTGAVLWENPMKGLGYGLIGMPGSAGTEAASIEATRQRQAAAAGS